MSDNKRVIWVRAFRNPSFLPGGCLSGALWPFLLGLGFFTALMSLLMSLFGGANHQSGTPGDGDNLAVPYPYNPNDPTEGGTYPNPNDPSRPIAALPPGQGGGSIFPVLPGQIVIDPIDSLRQIVSDRINVLLDKQNDDTGKAFMTEFKQLYPGNEFQFIYFDTLSYRLQIVVPPEKQSYLKENLNKEMPQFDFLLFDEEVFGLSTFPSDPGFKDGKKSWYFKAINAPQAWQTTKGDKNLIVAVVDNGFDLNHAEFTDKVVKPMNIPERNTHIFPIIEQDGSDHGTHVASTAIGNTDNGVGVCGIAPNCRFMPVQVATGDGMMLNTAVMDGVLYAIYNGASVINVSLGPTSPEWFRKLVPSVQQRYISKEDQRLTQVWNKIYQIADKNKCTLVVSAGNDNILSGFASKARTDTVIVVSAVDEGLRKASFSNYGNFAGWQTNYSTVSAPGVNIYNAVNRGQFAYMQGTSMASPIVAGAVALIKSVNPDLSTMEIIRLLQQTGRQLSDPIGPFIQIDRAVESAKEKRFTHRK